MNDSDSERDDMDVEKLEVLPEPRISIIYSKLDSAVLKLASLRGKWFELTITAFGE